MNEEDLQKLRCGLEISQKHDNPPDISYWTLFELITIAERASQPTEAGSVDTPEFRKMMDALGKWNDIACRDSMIAHLNADKAAAVAKAREEGRKLGKLEAEHEHVDLLAARQAPDLSKLTQYELVTGTAYDGPDEIGEVTNMEEHPEGTYVCFADVQAFPARPSQQPAPTDTVPVNAKPEYPPLPRAAAMVKSDEWKDALSKSQSFNGWRVNYGDCDVDLYTADQMISLRHACFAAFAAQPSPAQADVKPSQQEGGKDAARYRWLRDSQQAAEPVTVMEALRPFAEAYRPEVHTQTDDPKFQEFLDRNTVTPQVTMGDFRRAHEAYRSAPPQQVDTNGLPG